MDHVLHNKANLSKADKDKLAIKFENQFYGRPAEFRDFFIKNSFSVQGEYKDTWEFIKVETNSLKRYSNFAVYLKNIK